MKENIYTIPISEVFEPKCGCPLCHLYETLELRWVEYISGAAMMEPDIRIETNAQGFCHPHYEQMIAVQKRLSVALILQSHLIHMNETLLEQTSEKKRLFNKSPLPTPSQPCFVCERIQKEFARISENIAITWEKELDFQGLFRAQEFLCYPHFRLLATAARTVLKDKTRTAFLEESAALTRKKLEEVKKNIDSFTVLFDHRNAGGSRPPQEIALAIEHAVAYLTAHPFSEKG